MKEILSNYINYYINYCLTIKNLLVDTIKPSVYSNKYYFKYYNENILNNKYDNYLDIDIDIIQSLHEKDFYNYICYLINNNLNIRTRRGKIQHLKSFFDYLCHIKQVINYNPLNNIVKEKCYLKIKSKALEKLEINQ